MLRANWFLVLVTAFTFGQFCQAEDAREVKFVVSGNEAFSLKASAFFQGRFTADEKKTGVDKQTFDVAQARLGFNGSAYKPSITYGMVLKAGTLGNSNGLQLLQGWLAYEFSDKFKVKAGRMLLPYSRELYTHPGELLFADISGADLAFNLPYSTGILGSGQAGRVGYNVAALNSVRGLDGTGQQNHTNHLAYLARVEVDIAGSYGYMGSIPKPPAGLQASVGVAGNYNPIAEDSEFQNVNMNDTSTGYTVDFGLRFNRLNTQGAYYSRRTTANNTADSDDTGFFLQAGYFVCPEHLEIAARYSNVNWDRQRNANTAGDSAESTIGTNYYFEGHNLKMQADYTLIDVSPFAAGTDDYQDRQFRLQAQFLF